MPGRWTGAEGALGAYVRTVFYGSDQSPMPRRGPSHAPHARLWESGVSRIDPLCSGWACGGGHDPVVHGTAEVAVSPGVRMVFARP